MLTLSISHAAVTGEADPGGSKSISNRMLVLRALAKAQMPIYNVSPSNDTAVLVPLLKENPYEWNIADAGTAARFSAAYLATRVGEEHVLTGTGRMLQRPMKPLLDTLAVMGAEITYMDNEGFLPVKIKGAKLSGGNFRLPHDVSSQFVSALALIAPWGEADTVLAFDATPLSQSYIQMTLALLAQAYIHHEYEYAEDGSERLTVYKGTPSLPAEYWVEPDWSSASYWYAAIALADEGELFLPGYAESGIQGDELLASLFDPLGVSTRFTEEGMWLKKTHRLEAEEFEFDFSDNPDLAPTFAVVLPLLGLPARLTGLHTLRHKESDRVTALAENLVTLGITVSVSPDGNGLEIAPAPKTLSPDALIRCHGDHRMAMAFAPAVLKARRLRFDSPETVEKSYPGFWEQVAVTYKSSILNY